jgi:hypothetical protein
VTEGGYQVRFNTRSRSMTKSSLRISSRVSSIVCCDWRIASRVSATISAVRRAIASPSGFAQEIAEIIDEGMKLKADGVGGE